MSELHRPQTRPLSASRKRRQGSRRSSLNIDPKPSSSPEPNDFYPGLDLRTTKEKIDSLIDEMNLHKDDTTPEEYLDSLVLIQLYTSLEYGEKSIENARTYINLSKYYFEQRNLLPQAKTHILNARQILEKLNIKPNDDHLIQNLLGFEIYYLLIKYSFHAKKYSSQRDIKTKNKHILSIDTTHIDHDLNLLNEYLIKLKALMSEKEYDEKHIEYLLIKFDIITNNLKEYNRNIIELVDGIIEYFNKYLIDDQGTKQIEIYLRYGFYLIHFGDKNIAKGLSYFKEAVELAEKEEEREASDLHRYQLANAFFQWGKARVRADRLSDNTEKKFHRAIKIYKDVNGENDIKTLEIIDELATFYTKVERFQDALNVLCDSLPDKKRIFGDFSEEVTQTESRIGAIYLRECDYLLAAEHLKECLDLQEFIYGSKDPRTCQTRDALEILKKDPKVSRTFFSKTHEGIRQDRPVFRVSNKVSYDKQDHELLLTVTKKPPMSARN